VRARDEAAVCVRKSDWKRCEETRRKGWPRGGAKGRGYEEEECRDRNEGTRRGLTKRRERERRR
jgi:hypothetical protein